MWRLTVGALRALNALLRDSSGAVAIIVVFALPILMGFTGLAIDVSYWYLERRGLQTAADAAAVAGTLEIVNNNAAGVDAAARTDAGRNGVDATCVADPACVVVNNPPTSGPNDGNTASVEVIITQQLPLFFSRIFLSDPVQVQARAVANTIVQPGNGCLLALDPTAAASVQVVGGARIELAPLPAPGCELVVNSSSPTALTLTGTSEIEGPSVKVVGGIRQTGGANLEADSVETGSPPAADPLANLDVPTLPPCFPGTPPGLVITTTGPLPGTAPRRFCGGLRIEGNSTVNIPLPAGQLFITEGDLTVTGNSRLEGDETVIFLTGSPASTTGSLRITGNSRVEVSSPTSGPFTGISIYQDRNAPTAPPATNVNQITGVSELEINGTLYFPSQEFIISGNSRSETEPNGCAKVIARKVTVSGGSSGSGPASEIEINCDPNSPAAAAVPLGGPRVSRLGE